MNTKHESKELRDTLNRTDRIMKSFRDKAAEGFAENSEEKVPIPKKHVKSPKKKQEENKHSAISSLIDPRLAGLYEESLKQINSTMTVSHS